MPNAATSPPATQLERIARAYQLEQRELVDRWDRISRYGLFLRSALEWHRIGRYSGCHSNRLSKDQK